MLCVCVVDVMDVVFSVCLYTNVSSSLLLHQLYH